MLRGALGRSILSLLVLLALLALLLNGDSRLVRRITHFDSSRQEAKYWLTVF